MSVKQLNPKRVAALSALCLSTLLPAHADEGMWTLYNLPQQVYSMMQAEGFTMPYDSLYNAEGSLKDAVVNFSGYCTGVVVSPDGLVFTNHHCGFEAIRRHSTVEHDYMLNGFIANSLDEELPNEDMFVSFMKEQRDITPQVEALNLDSKPADTRAMLIDSLQQAMTDSIHAIDSTLHINIDAFYEGNRWYATTYQDYTDLRLVFAIPKSMGKFGGETDNWMWPRQTCDFSVFRIYADPKTNRPAAYSKDNVPYHPQRWAQVSLDGYKDGSYAMTLGYPGSTERYLSSYGIKEMRDAANAPRAQVRGVKQEVMLRHMRASEAVRIKYDSKFANSSNYWKNSIGMNKCIDSIGLIRQKQEYEARIMAWQDSTGYLKDRLDLPSLGKLYGRRYRSRYTLTNFSETFFGTNEFCTRALSLRRMDLHGKPGSKKEYIEFADNSSAWDEALDKEVFATLLDNYRKHVDKEYLPAFYKTIDSKYGGDYTKYVDWIWANSAIMQSGKKIYVNRKSYLKDPGVQFSIDLIDIIGKLSGELETVEDSINFGERWLCAAKVRMEEDMPHYSDANFTMRLSYGQVGGFSLGGHDSGYFTTPESIVEKMKRGDNGVIDYQAEPVMHELMSAADFGRYADKADGKLHLCFLTNNDITGGNSGSPMFDGKGQLIGLAFDGNWDSLSADINYDKRLARTIGVDIRYVLYLMDRWGHASRLLRELGIAAE